MKQNVKKGWFLLLVVCLVFAMMPAAQADEFGSEFGLELLGVNGRPSVTDKTINIQTPGTLSATSGVFRSTNNANLASVAYENGTSGPKVVQTPVTTGSNSGFFLRNMIAADGPYRIGGKMYRWEIKVKLPAVSETGYTDLFYYNGNSTPTDTTAKPIRLQNGNVNIIQDYKTSATTYAAMPLNDNGSSYTIQSDTWYKIVRLMDFTTPGENMQKVFVYKESTDSNFDVLLGESAWKQTGSMLLGYQTLSTTSSSEFYTLQTCGFIANNYDAAVKFKDLGLYNTNYSSILSVGASNKVLSYKTEMNTKNNKTTFVGLKKDSFPKAKAHRISMDLFVPQTTNQDAFIKMFSFYNSSTFTEDNYAAAIRGTTLYARTSSGEIAVGTVTPNKWYKIVYEIADASVSPIMHNLYLFERGGATSIAKYEAYNTGATYYNSATTFYTNSYAACTVEYIGGLGYDKYILMDNIVHTGWTNSLGGTVLNMLITEDMTFESYELGYDFVKSMYLTNKTIRPWIQRILSVNEESYLYTGATIQTLNPHAVTMQFTSDIEEGSFNKDNIKFTSDGAGLTNLYDLSYNAATKTGTISFKKLSYDTSYNLSISRDIQSSLAGMPLYEGYSFDFKTYADPFEVKTMQFKDEANNVINALSLNGKVKASVELSNLSEDNKDYVVILAIYKNNVLKDIRVASGAINAGVASEVVDTDTYTVSESGCTASIMVWNNWTDIQPQSDMTSIQ